MENEAVVSSEATSTSASPAASTSTPAASTSAPAAAATSSTETPTLGGEGAAGVPTPAAFIPNFKFKVMDKDHEIPEFLRGAIKDPETEKQLRELHEKAFGLDVVKPKYQTTKTQLEEVTRSYGSLQKSVTTLGKFIQKDDLDSFFKAINIPEEQVLRYALQRVQYRELTPEQRMQYDAQTDARQRVYQLETQNEDLQQRWMNESVQARTTQLETALERPEVKSIATAFDAKAGKPGAFRAEVINRGLYAHYAAGTDIPVEQAVSEVLQTFRPFIESGAASVTPVQAPVQMGTSAAAAAPQQPPVIPNVAGRSTSPAKRIPKSLDDLREMARAL